MVADVPATFHAITGLVVQPGPRPVVADGRFPTSPDVVLRAAGTLFIFTCRANSSPAIVHPAIAQLKWWARRLEGMVVPVLVVRHMSAGGRQLCEMTGMQWMDLSGNASIQAPGLKVVVEGKRDLSSARGRGRPRTVFASKSARVARHLLLHPQESFTQRDIAKRTSLSEGMVSRVVRGLEEAALVDRDADNRVKVTSPDLLLDTWLDEYNFDHRRIIPFHGVARSGELLTQQVSTMLQRASIEHAATGLAAAWFYEPHAAFRLTTFYVQGISPAEAGRRIGLRPVKQGANVWLVRPPDTGVFEGYEERHGTRCVSAVQTYLDLKGHPERAKEAAEVLRRTRLTWRLDEHQAIDR